MTSHHMHGRLIGMVHHHPSRCGALCLSPQASVDSLRAELQSAIVELEQIDLDDVRGLTEGERAVSTKSLRSINYMVILI